MGGFVKKIVRKLTDCLAEEYGLKHEELAFAAFVINVNPTKPGWDKGIRKLLRNNKGVRCFKLDGATGVVEVSGIFDPMKLIKKIGKCRGVGHVQYGKCCSNLYMPPPATTQQQQQQDTKKLDPPPPPPPPPPLQHNYPYNPSNYGYNALPCNTYNCSHNLSLPPPSYFSYYGGEDIYGYDDYQLARAPPYYYAPHHYY